MLLPRLPCTPPTSSPAPVAVLLPRQADFGLARMYGSPDRRYTNQVGGQAAQGRGKHPVVLHLAGRPACLAARRAPSAYRAYRRACPSAPDSAGLSPVLVPFHAAGVCPLVPASRAAVWFNLLRPGCAWDAPACPH